MIDKVAAILEADSPVNTAASGGIWFEEVPQAKVPPYIILGIIDGDPNDTKNGPSELDQIIIQVTCYGKRMFTKSSTVGAYTLSALVRTALDHYDDTIESQKLFIRAMNTPETLDISIPNKPLMGCEQEFEVYVTR